MKKLTSEVLLTALTGAVSASFAGFVKDLISKKKQPEEIGKKTIDELAEKQAEGLTYEQIYLNLLSAKITEKQAEEMIKALGEKMNPNPLAWLKKRLLNIRGWIISAIKFLRAVGNELRLKISQITVELSLTPRVTITFEPS